MLPTVALQGVEEAVMDVAVPEDDDVGGVDGLSPTVSVAARPNVDPSRAVMRREVGPEHVGSRVSLRYLIDDESGPRPTDRVGRLVSCEADGWILVDRAGTLHVIDPTMLVASRLVPPHPRLPPEPTGTSPDAAIHRDAARVLLLDAQDRALLIAHLPGDGRTVWTAPGGGLDPGETHPQAAARELREELGVDLELGPWVWSRSVTFAFRGVWLHQVERWFTARIGTLDVDMVPLSDLATDGARWWTLGELDVTNAVLAPRTLATHLAALLRDGPPPGPIDVGP
jgi:8-oxo-dGTP pyrophosphatase MutT (NUDIX family)